MSLAIDVDEVRAVLLADGWHDVKDESFEIDAYEFVRGDEPRLLGGQSDGVCSAGARWREAGYGGSNDREIFCPLTSILAVKC